MLSFVFYSVTGMVAGYGRTWWTCNGYSMQKDSWNICWIIASHLYVRIGSWSMWTVLWEHSNCCEQLAAPWR